MRNIDEVLAESINNVDIYTSEVDSAESSFNYLLTRNFPYMYMR